jgi:site-specific DNA-methyltransferase (adenine-specific)
VSKIELMKGDCLERMKEIPDGSVDLILTDPPYNIAKPNNFHTMGRAGIDFGEWDKGFDLFSYIDGLSRVCTKNANIVIFNDWKNIGEIAKYAETKGFVIKDMLRWEKSNPMPRNRDRRFVVDYEVAVWLTMPKAKWVFNRQSDTYDRPCFKGSLTPSSEKTEHTTQKPVWLMENILKTLSNEGDTVLDLFMGSGTTGVACVNTNRSFVGIELDDNYFNIAEKRIQEALDNKENNINAVS